jgi:5'-deoxynucleotidase YfbR-like HD superfamily hydrolase
MSAVAAAAAGVEDDAGQGRRAPPALMPLVRELCDLKRVRSAGRAGSVAERLFAEAWARIAGGAAPEAVARGTIVAALAAARLGDLDAATLEAAGVPRAEAARILRRAAEEAAAPLDPGLGAWLLGRDGADAPPTAAAPPPPFVARLAAQPRAGATCPGRGRLVLEPPESHADHCALVAVLGALLAPAWGARAETVFLAGLAHHLHNVLLPDSGFSGEVLLGEWLEPAMAGATALALEELAPGPRALVEEARRILPDAGTPEGRAFHAADTLDRVLQVEHHLRAAGTTMDFVLREMELVHAGPVKPFQDAVLARMGLAA